MNQKTTFLQASYYKNLKSKESMVISVARFIAEIRSNRWEKMCRGYREYMNNGTTAKAQLIKQAMPGITVAGIFEGGHSTSCFRAFSGIISIDIDKYEGNIHSLRQQLEEMPNTVAVFLSISGKGLKVFVRVDIPEVAQYTSIYLRVMLHYERVTGVKADEKCKDLPRLAFASHDPDAWFNPEAAPFVPDGSTADLEYLICREEQRKPIVSGQRNNNLLLFAKQAALHGFTQQETTGFFIGRYREPDFTAEEIASVTASGYGYAVPSPVRKMAPVGDKRVPGATMSPKYGENREEEEDERVARQEENDEKERGKASRIPDEVFDNLPIILREGIRVTGNDKLKRDMLLTGMITILSGCLPNVKFGYQRKRYSPHLYFFGVANPGTGKGIVDLAYLLALPTHEHYEREGKEKMKHYYSKQLEWEQVVRVALKNGNKPDPANKPEEPSRVYLLVPANSSRARYMIHLRDNGKLGGIIHCSEADDLTNALGQDYGNHTDLLRKAFHHEALSSSHKANGDPIHIANPRLALCMTGTPVQLNRFFGELEDGLFSRFLFHTLPTRFEWISCEPGENVVFDEDLFYDLGKKVWGFHKELLKSPVTVIFTAKQWARHKAVFREKVKEFELAGDPNGAAILFRHGLMVKRIAAVFTVLRGCEENFNFGSRYCTDQDYETALLIVFTSLEHSLLLSSSLPGTRTRTNPLSKFRRMEDFLKILPDFFTYTEMKNICKEESFPLRTAIRYLQKAVELKLLEKRGSIYYKV